MTGKVRRWWHIRGSLTAVLWAACVAGCIGLLITGHGEASLEVATLLIGVVACTRTSISRADARQRRTSETVTDSLEHFQEMDEFLAERVLKRAVLRLAESGQIIVAAEPRPAASMDDRRLWYPTAYYGGAASTNVVPMRSRVRASEAS